jgi:hypothetical protein
MRFLFFFLDGVGLGDTDPAMNPLARAGMPSLRALLDGQPLVKPSAPLHNGRASLLALDARLGVSGLPQSATGQAALLTGINIPAALGYHYGPKPNPATAAFLHDTLFSRFASSGKKTQFLNAYPPAYFQAIKSGRRIFSSIPQAVVNAGGRLRTIEDLFAGRAISADLTGQGWHEQLGFPQTPRLSAKEAGRRMARLARQADFSFFEYWLSDYAGHHQDMDSALELLNTLDETLSGLLSAWKDEEGLILFTSDHGNLEDLSTRRHTENRVPALVVGSPRLREAFVENLADLTQVAPAIYRLFEIPPH